ncbi:hypothetical protein [Actinopolymorpha sp. B9G3]|uniref:hypothetical protein n=1 Tax=Actinopolymorpha sp. B9G3 TaxID=3158970 RepID=UPI0032D90B85
MTTSSSSAPLVCDMTTASDTPEERMAEYARLFDHALAGRERTDDAVIWRFTARAGVEAWVRDLAEREAACCPFLTYTVTTYDDQVIYRIAGEDEPMVQAALDEIDHVPEHVADGFPGLLERLRKAGFDIRTSDDGAVTTASARADS